MEHPKRRIVMIEQKVRFSPDYLSDIICHIPAKCSRNLVPVPCKDVIFGLLQVMSSCCTKGIDVPTYEESKLFGSRNPAILARSRYDRFHFNPLQQCIRRRPMWFCVIFDIFPIVFKGHGDLICLFTDNNLCLDRVHQLP